MYLTQKNHIRQLKKREFMILKILTRTSKNLYNFTNWTIREYYRLTGKYLRYENAYHLVKSNENYQQMPSQVAQTTMKIVDRSFRSFFASLNKKRLGKYDKPLNIPSFLPKNGHFICIFPKGYFKIINKNILRISFGRWMTNKYKTRYLFFTIPKHIIEHTVKEIRIIPRFNAKYFEIEYVYNKKPIKIELLQDTYMGIDLGLDNFAACYSTNGTSFIIEGKGLKSYNRWWNKQNAKLQSIYSLQNIKYGKKKYFLNQKRKYKINEFMNQSVNFIIKKCIKEKIENIVIGELKDIKQHMHLGNKNNQHFWAIPYYKFKQKLKSKCELYGIIYHEIDERYTSQDCCICGRRRKSNRIKRGLYRCDICKQVYNADINGAINIANKVASKSAKIGGSGVVNTPYRIKIIGM